MCFCWYSLCFMLLIWQPALLSTFWGILFHLPNEVERNLVPVSLNFILPGLSSPILICSWSKLVPINERGWGWLEEHSFQRFCDFFSLGTILLFCTEVKLAHRIVSGRWGQNHLWENLASLILGEIYPWLPFGCFHEDPSLGGIWISFRSLVLFCGAYL